MDFLATLSARLFSSELVDAMQELEEVVLNLAYCGEVVEHEVVGWALRAVGHLMCAGPTTVIQSFYAFTEVAEIVLDTCPVEFSVITAAWILYLRQTTTTHDRSVFVYDLFNKFASSLPVFGDLEEMRL
jgi:hypothetical protein